MLAVPAVITAVATSIAVTQSPVLASSKQPRHAASRAANVLSQAEAAVAAASKPETAWLGPTSGPPAARHEKVACVNGSPDNDTYVEWCKGVTEAAQAIGWQVLTVNASGSSLSDQSAAITQAIGDNVTGLVLPGIDASTQQSAIAQAVTRHIPVVTIQGLANPGPAPKYHVFAVVTQSGPQIGKIAADIAIASAHGKANVILVDDPIYQIAREKTAGAADEIRACATCHLLTTLNSPIAQATSLFPGQITSLASKYASAGRIFYISISDYYFDYGAPALKSSGVSNAAAALIGTDGSPAAYQRIRSGEYEIATIPPPEREQGWEAIDELNRAFHHDRWSGYIPPVQIVDRSNIARLITKNGYYVPPNDYQQHYKKLWGVK